MTDSLFFLKPFDYDHDTKVFTKLIAAKEYINNIKTKDIPDHTFVKGFEMPFADFDEFAGILMAMADERTHYIVRGGPREDLDLTRYFKRRHRQRDDGKLPSIVPTPRRWVLVDIDDIYNEFEVGWTNYDEMMAFIDWIKNRTLGPEWQHVSYFWQWSNTMALNNDWSVLKLHLWFLLDHAVDDDVLRSWAKAQKNVDFRPFVTSQPNIISNPYLIDTVDYIGNLRTGIWKGTSDEVVFEFIPPAIEVDDFYLGDVIDTDKYFKEWQPREYKGVNVELKELRHALVLNKQANGCITTKVSKPMESILKIGFNGRCHPYILSSANSWIRCLGANPDRELWKTLVRDQVDLSGNPSANARKQDTYLNQTWADAKTFNSPMNINNPNVPYEYLQNNNAF